MGVVPKEKAGVGSAINDATRMFGATLGVAVIGSIAASLYASQLAATIPTGLPHQAALAAKGSVGSALAAAQSLADAGLDASAQALSLSAIAAFFHSFSWALRVAGAVAIGGALFAAGFLPARPDVAPSAAQGLDVTGLEPSLEVSAPLLELDEAESEHTRGGNATSSS